MIGAENVTDRKDEKCTPIQALSSEARKGSIGSMIILKLMLQKLGKDVDWIHLALNLA
jgi:hypothetical protein